MTEKTGWLLKKGERQNDGWKRRWFELKDDKLEYFEKPGSKKKGEIDLQACTAVRESTAWDARPREFEVIARSRTYRLESEDNDGEPGGRRSWIATLALMMPASQIERRSIIPSDEPEPEPEPGKVPNLFRCEVLCCKYPGAHWR